MLKERPGNGLVFAASPTGHGKRPSRKSKTPNRQTAAVGISAQMAPGRSGGNGHKTLDFEHLTEIQGPHLPCLTFWHLVLAT